MTTENINDVLGILCKHKAYFCGFTKRGGFIISTLKPSP